MPTKRSVFIRWIAVVIVTLVLSALLSTSVVSVAIASESLPGNTSEWQQIAIWLLVTVLPVLVYMYFASEMRRIEASINGIDERTRALEGNVMYKDSERRLSEDLKEMTTLINELRTELSEFKLDVTKNLVTKDEMRDFFNKDK